MADPKQLRVLKKLTALIEGINPDNNDPATEEPYEIDLRGKVFRGRSVLTVDAAENTISILEMPRQEVTAPVGTGAVRNDEWALILQGWPSDNEEHPGDSAYKLKAMIEQRLFRIIAEKASGRGPLYPDDYRLGKHEGIDELTSFTFAPGVVRPPEDTASRLAMFYMPLVLGLRVDVGDPFG